MWVFLIVLFQSFNKAFSLLPWTYTRFVWSMKLCYIVYWFSLLQNIFSFSLLHVAWRSGFSFSDVPIPTIGIRAYQFVATQWRTHSIHHNLHVIMLWGLLTMHQAVVDWILFDNRKKNGEHSIHRLKNSKTYNYLFIDVPWFRSWDMTNVVWIIKWEAMLYTSPDLKQSE